MAGFDKYLRAVTTQAGHEAGADGSATIEAQHLLLAIAGQPEPTTRQLLDSVGLDREVIRRLLAREFEHSLNAVGISCAAYDLPRPSRLPTHPTMGTSAKLAMERGFVGTPRKNGLQPVHLLLGVLSAQVGTVPRALALAGIDRDDLVSRVRQTITDQ